MNVEKLQEKPQQVVNICKHAELTKLVESLSYVKLVLIIYRLISIGMKSKNHTYKIHVTN